MMEEYKPPDDVSAYESTNRDPRKFQAIIYAMGLILAIVTFTEFYYGNLLQNQIGEYEKKVDEFEILREKALSMEEDYTRVWYSLMKDDVTAYLQYDEGSITYEEANMKIFLHVLEIQNLWFDFTELFLKDYENENTEWLFTEGVFDFRYNEYPGYIDDLKAYFDYYSDLPDGDVLDDWQISGYSPDKYFYYNTHNALTSIIWYCPMDVFVLIEVFDAYVQENFLTPLDRAEANLLYLQISTNTNTIGLLILGFLMNFEDVSQKWKAIYIVITMFSLFSGFLMTYLTLFG